VRRRQADYELEPGEDEDGFANARVILEGAHNAPAYEKGRTTDVRSSPDTSQVEQVDPSHIASNQQHGV